jgi:hypothetical protein
VKGTPRICNEGHRYYKSSDCPTCPVCEEARKPDSGFLSSLASPARRALTNAGIKTLKQLSAWNEVELLDLHGMGPNAIIKLTKSLKANGLTFRKK